MDKIEREKTSKKDLWQKARIVKNEFAPWLVGQEIWVQGRPHPPDRQMVSLEHNERGDLRNSRIIKVGEDMRPVVTCSICDDTTGMQLWYRFDDGVELLNEFCSNPPMVSFQGLLKKEAACIRS